VKENNLITAMLFDDDDDNDDFFDWEDFGGNFDPDQLWQEQDAHNQRVRQLPIFLKAEEIMEITEAIVATIDHDADLLMMHEQMLCNAIMLPTKIMGAEGGDLYSIRMENAVLIRIYARDLQTQVSFCEDEQLCEPDYLDLLREELENFRILFVNWVGSFDRDNDVPDEWGLFL
jgi:hypothetical protein